MLSKPFGLCGYFPVNLLGCFAGTKVGAAPLNQDKSFPLKTRQLLLRELLEGSAVAVVHLGNQHLHPQDAVRLRGDGEDGVVGVLLRGEGDKALPVFLQLGQPVGDEIVLLQLV